MSTELTVSGSAPLAFMPTTLEQALVFSEQMSKAQLLPMHLRGKPADCLRVVMQAARWQMDPFSVADKTSVIKDKLMYEGQLVSAVVNARGNLSKRLNYHFDGTANNRVLTVRGTIKGEDEPRDITLTFQQAVSINQNGQMQKNPEQQMTYIGARLWARRHMPELMLGVYSDDEMPDGDDDEPKNVTTEGGTAERPAPPARQNRRGGASAAKSDASTADSAAASDAKVADPKFGGPTTDAEIVDATAEQGAEAAERDAALKADEERKATLAASEKAKADAAALASKLAADKARADVTVQSPEVMPGVSFEGYHGKGWDHPLSGTVKSVTVAVVPGSTPPKVYAKVEVDTGREVLPISTYEGVQIVDSKPMATLTALAPGGIIQFTVKPQFNLAKDPATKKTIPGSPDRTRAPVLMARNITEVLGDELPA